MAKVPPALLLNGTGDFGVPLFPKSYHLVITTQKYIYSWDSRGLSELFCSGSEGIVAAKKAKDGSEMLAIADSQIVVLHDVKKGMDKSYRLKGAEGQVRLLRYSSDSKNLFFTTSLQNSVQSYSLTQSRLLDPFRDHPSPPTCLALSPTSHLLLSCSASPPTIFLQNLTLHTPPLNMRPSASAAAVTVANFHPERPNIFLLAFVDGALAAYDATGLFRDGNCDRRVGIAGTLAAREIAHFAILKGPNTSTILHRPEEAAIGKTGEGLPSKPMGNRAATITAAEFLPGFRARAITVGADGKCNLIDFEPVESKRAVILKSWHARAPATSLSILREGPWPCQMGHTSEHAPVNRKNRSIKGGTAQTDMPWLVAIGRVDGKVLIFDSNGELRGEKTVDPRGGEVIDVEWAPEPADIGCKSRPASMAVSAKLNKKPTLKIISKRPESHSLGSKKKRKSMSEVLAAGRVTAEEILPDVKGGRTGQNALPPQETIGEAILIPESPILEKGSPKHALWQDVMEPPTVTYMSLFSPVKQKTRRQSSKAATVPVSGRRSSRINCAEESQDRQTGSAISAPLLACNATCSQPLDTSLSKQPTVVNPGYRDPRSHDSGVREQNSPSRPGTVESEDEKLLSQIRSMSGKRANAPGKGLALFAPYMQKCVSKGQTAASNQTSPVSKMGSSEGLSDTLQRNALLDDIWLPESSGNEASVPRNPRTRRKSSRKPPKLTSKLNKRSPRSVSFQASTEAELDNVGTSENSLWGLPFVNGDCLEPKKRAPIHYPQPSDFHSAVTREASAKHISQPGPLVETTNNHGSSGRQVRGGTGTMPLSGAASSPDALSKANFCCSSHLQLHDDVARLRETIQSFQVETIKQFQAQKLWFEEVVAEQRRANDAVRGENERLRRELFEVVKGEVRAVRLEQN